MVQSAHKFISLESLYLEKKKYDDGNDSGIDNDSASSEVHPEKKNPIRLLSASRNCSSKLRTSSSNNDLNELPKSNRLIFWRLPKLKNQKFNKKSPYTTEAVSNDISNLTSITNHNSMKIPLSCSKTSDLGESFPSSPEFAPMIYSMVLYAPGSLNAGMHNLGNTCYINSVLQCLVHVDLFSEYFARQLWMEEPKYKKINLINDKSLTNSLATIIKALWGMRPYSIDTCHSFYSVISLQSNHYYNVKDQQDAHEFLMWFINKIHEENVQIPKSRQLIKKKNKEKKTNEENAIISFAFFTQYLHSYIQGLFLSQYCSSITCPNCKKRSSTFDPYTCLSLSLPEPKTKIVFVNYRSANCYEPIKRLGFSFKKTQTIAELHELLVQRFKCKLTLIEFHLNGNLKELRSDFLISGLSSHSASVYALESINCLSVEEPTKEREDCVVTLIVNNIILYRQSVKSFGSPLAINVHLDISFQEIQNILQKNMHPLVKKQLYNTLQIAKMRLGLRTIYKKEFAQEFLKYNIHFPLQEASVKRRMKKDEACELKFLYLVAEWEPLHNEWHMGMMSLTEMTEDESCQNIHYSAQEEWIDLRDCLTLQTQEEKLPIEDLWLCRFCHKEQQGMTKQLTLWSLPDILVFHLKRFDGSHDKISTTVSFPIKSLNMAPYVTDISRNNLHSSKAYRKQTKCMNYLPPPQSTEECIYDLVSVCNHLGLHIHSGHYTATCLNSADGQWYYFDDRNVRVICEEEIVTSGAYMLFYQKRTLSSRASRVISKAR